MNQESNTKSYVVLVGVDYSESSALALVEAIRLARAHTRSQIHLVHAIPGMPPLAPALASSDLNALPTSAPTLQGQLAADVSSDMKAFVERALERLDTGRRGAEADPDLAWTIHLQLLDPAHAIAQLASDLEADLVVVGTHGRKGLSRFLLGSVAEGVVRLSPCPVLVVRPVGAQSAAPSPAIEPPCPECLEARAASAGKELWCDRHTERHGRAHTYHFTPFRDSHQSGLLLHPLK
jgi:nucleotide-binding universal stress UspA family protein